MFRGLFRFAQAICKKVGRIEATNTAGYRGGVPVWRRQFAKRSALALGLLVFGSLAAMPNAEALGYYRCGYYFGVCNDTQDWVYAEVYNNGHYSGSWIAPGEHDIYLGDMPYFWVRPWCYDPCYGWIRLGCWTYVPGKFRCCFPSWDELCGSRGHFYEWDDEVYFIDD